MTYPEVLAGVLRPQSDLLDPPPKSVGMPDHPPLLTAVRQSHQASVAAREAFVDAVWAAHEAGCANLRIAGHAGMTEAGIRMLLKRTRTRRKR